VHSLSAALPECQANIATRFPAWVTGLAIAQERELKLAIVLMGGGVVVEAGKATGEES